MLAVGRQLPEACEVAEEYEYEDVTEQIGEGSPASLAASAMFDRLGDLSENEYMFALQNCTEDDVREAIQRACAETA